MSGPSIVKETPIERRAQLVEYAASGARTPDRWKIGTEHEKFGFRQGDDKKPLPYEGEDRHPRHARRHDALRLGARDRGQQH